MTVIGDNYHTSLLSEIQSTTISISSNTHDTLCHTIIQELFSELGNCHLEITQEIDLFRKGVERAALTSSSAIHQGVMLKTGLRCIKERC